MIKKISSSPSASNGSRRLCSCGHGNVLEASSMDALCLCSAFHHQPFLRLAGGMYGVSCEGNVSDEGTLRCCTFWRFADIVCTAGLRQARKSCGLVEGQRGDCSGRSLRLI